MFRSSATWIALVVLIGAIVGVYAFTRTPSAASNEAKARTVVDAFGKALQEVSLMGDQTMVSDAMAREYGPYVTPQLLAEWQRDPLSAPGRLTSSPWPDRIEISRADRGVSGFRVEGSVIEVTNEGGGINEPPTEAIRRPITLTLEKSGSSYRINAVQLGAYPGDGDWTLSTTTSQGIQFMYPTRLPTTYISTQEWPPKVTLEGGIFSCKKETLAIGDRTYCISKTNEGAAGSTYTTYDYATQQGDFIARVQFVLRFPQCLNYEGDQQKTCSHEQSSFDVNGLVDRIASSIRMQ